MLLGDKHKTNPVGLEDSIQNIEEEEPEEEPSSKPSKPEEKPRKCSERFKINMKKVTPSRQSELLKEIQQDRESRKE